MSRPLLLLAACACALLPLTGCVERETGLHLVVDAGSSGTRFCLFQVEAISHTGCRAAPAAKPFEACRKVEARDGLAELSPVEIDTVLKAGLDQFPEQVRAHLKGVVVLGTGGFRRKSPADRQGTVEHIERFFAAQSLPAHVEVISGETEGELAWHTIRLLMKSTDHAVLETGGATIQFAAAARGDAVRAISLPLGMNESFRALRRDPRFAACYALPGKARKLDFAACTALIQTRVFADASLGNFVGQVVSTQAGSTGSRLYGLGAPWSALFDMAGRDELDLKEIRTKGAEFCAKSLTQLTAAGIPAKHAPRTCYLWAYQTALLEATGLTRIVAGGESWPRGAAASGTYFEDCAVSK